MMAGNCKLLCGKMVCPKKYLYALRSMLACLWILSHCSPSPIQFDTLVAAGLDTSLRVPVAELLTCKRSNGEHAKIPRIDEINDYLEKNLTLLKGELAQLYEPDGPVLDLDEVFLALLQMKREPQTI